MVKQKYKTEHILTIESVKSVVWSIFIGLLFLISSTGMFYYVFTTDCCSLGNACDLPSLIGLIIIFVFALIIGVFGFVLFFMSGLWIENPKEVKIKVEG